MLTMKPETVDTAPVDLEPVLARHLEALLRACGFDVRNSPECSDLFKTLHNFGRFICDRYSVEITEQLRRPENDKTREQLVSWTISELCMLQAVTFQKFGTLITNAESTSLGTGSIDCQTAAMYSYRLSEIYQSAVDEWKRIRGTDPLSSRHVEKRRRRKWAPYLVDIFFKPKT